MTFFWFFFFSANLRVIPSCSQNFSNLYVVVKLEKWIGRNFTGDLVIGQRNLQHCYLHICIFMFVFDAFMYCKDLLGVKAHQSKSLSLAPVYISCKK